MATPTKQVPVPGSLLPIHWPNYGLPGASRAYGQNLQSSDGGSRETVNGSGETVTSSVRNSYYHQQQQQLHNSTNQSPPLRRPRGRPPGKKNDPKKQAMKKSRAFPVSNSSHYHFNYVSATPEHPSSLMFFESPSSPPVLPGSMCEGSFRCNPFDQNRARNTFVVVDEGESVIELSKCLAWGKEFNCQQTYDKYLEVLGKHHAKTIDDLGLFREICQLLVHHPKQLEQIAGFTPPVIENNDADAENSSHILPQSVELQVENVATATSVDIPTPVPAATDIPVVLPAAVISEPQSTGEGTPTKISALSVAPPIQFCGTGFPAQVAPIPVNLEYAKAAIETGSSNFNSVFEANNFQEQKMKLAAELDAKLKERNPKIYEQYKEIMSQFTEFTNQSFNEISANVQNLMTRFEQERRRVHGRVEKMLLNSFSDEIENDERIQHEIALTPPNQNDGEEQMIVIEEVLVETEADTSPNDFPDQNDMDLDMPPEVTPTSFNSTDVNYQVGLADEMSLFGLDTRLASRVKHYPSLFDLSPNEFSQTEEFSNILEEKVKDIVLEDTDHEKWKTLLIKSLVLARVFVRSPRLRDSISGVVHLRGPVVVPIVERSIPGYEALSVGRVSTAQSKFNCNGSPTCCADREDAGIQLTLEGSYCKYPLLEGISTFSGRTPLCDEVLNDDYCSVSPVPLFRLPIRNKDEVTMDAFEDARYEVDVMLYRNETTMTVLTDALKRMKNMSQSELDCCEMDNLFECDSVACKTAIEWIFQGDRVMLGLRKFPALFVPRVLEALKVKDKEWIEMRGRWNALVSSEMLKLCEKKR